MPIFSGTPPAPGITTVNVTASDGQGGNVTDQFRILIGNVTTTTTSLTSTSSSVRSSVSSSSSSTSRNTLQTSVPSSDQLSSSQIVSQRVTSITTSQQVTSSKEPSSKVLLILGIILGAICGLGFVGVLTAYLLRRNKDQDEN